MNQQILFNDDIAFDENQQAWNFTGLLAGERITITIKTESTLKLTDELRFNFEDQVEEWLEDNEPPENCKIELLYK